MILKFSWPGCAEISRIPPCIRTASCMSFTVGSRLSPSRIENLTRIFPSMLGVIVDRFDMECVNEVSRSYSLASSFPPGPDVMPLIFLHLPSALGTTHSLCPFFSVDRPITLGSLRKETVVKFPPGKETKCPRTKYGFRDVHDPVDVFYFKSHHALGNRSWLLGSCRRPGKLHFPVLPSSVSCRKH
jgi:hypothetical protein